MTAPAIDFDAVWEQCQTIRDEHQELRRRPPLVRLWANDPTGAPGLVLRGIASDTISGSAPLKKNTPTTAVVRFRADYYLARWLISIPNDRAAKKNTVLTIDTMGGAMRWNGILKHWKFAKDKDGIRYLEATFIHDLQYLDFLLGAPNPALPLALFQFPRVFGVVAPSIWAISLLIYLNVARYEGDLAFSLLPFDPFDGGSWSGSSMDNWQVLVKSPSFFDDSSLWTLIASRMDKVSTVIADALDDGQLVIRARRLLTVDGETADIPGVSNPCNGALIFEVLDESGYFGAAGTATTGTALDGFARTVVGFLDGFIEDDQTLTTNDQSTFPPEYFLAGFLGMVPSHPWIVLRDTKYSGIETAELTWAPATAGEIVVGGGNEYADSAVELAIQAVGNILGYFLLGGFSSAGDIAATVIMPLLRGTILAWNNWISEPRIDALGWAHLMQWFQQGANNAWTIAAVVALRAGMRATASETSFQMDIRNGAPFLIGLHMNIGNRVAGTIEGMTGSVTTDPLFVQQLEEANLAWDHASDEPFSYEIKAGTGKASMTAAERSARLLSKTMATIQNIGVTVGV